MKKHLSKWLIGITSILLIGLTVNQVIYAVSAAEDQEKALNEKVEIALDVIVDKVSENQSLCSSVNKCLNTENKMQCCKYLNGEEEWKAIDGIIKSELERFHINLNYNFDFCKSQPDDKNTYTMHMDKVFQGSGIVMYLEFPDRSMYLMKQMGPVFISSVLLIIFIFIAFIVMFRYYQREKKLVIQTRDFINNMTHEFKTPLANIAFANNLISKENAHLNSDKLTRYSNIIKEENQRLVSNCEDLLAIGMAENGLNTDLESISIHEQLHEVIEYTKLVDQSTDLDISFNFEAKKDQVLGKKSLLKNVFNNLIDNAIKYSQTKSDITINTSSNSKEIIISIADKGIGISKENQKEVFGKFYRINNRDQHDVKGFGLGLAYVKMVVEQLKGCVAVESELGKGSTFIIKLPLNG